MNIIRFTGNASNIVDILKSPNVKVKVYDVINYYNYALDINNFQEVDKAEHTGDEGVALYYKETNVVVNNKRTYKIIIEIP